MEEFRDITNGSAEPENKSAEPVQESAEPVTEAAEPVVESAEPSQEPPDPVIISEEPVKEPSEHKGGRLVYINLPPPDEDEEAFWDEVLAVRPRRGRGKMVLWTVLLALTVLLILGYTVALRHGKGLLKSILPMGERISFTLPIAETPVLDGKYTEADGSYSAAGVAKAVLPSVVQIKAYTKSAVRASSQGSGIIMSDDGYIVTNAHVIAGADMGVTVMLYDRSEYAAKVVGSDDSSDIAVLKISTTGLTPAQFADSDTCELGDEVVAIGSPAGFENSVTKGIISGLQRQIHAENSAIAMQCIQIDAAINPGNSGGPLFNMWGQVLGITSSKLVSTSYDNIGFAITVNSAKPIIERLVEEGYVADKGRIGITYYALSEEAAKFRNLVPGLYINNVDEECDVSKTELKQGDIITEIAGIPVATQRNVNDVLDGYKAGETITCKVYRPGEFNEDEGTFGDGEYFEISFALAKDKNSMIEKKS